MTLYLNLQANFEALSPDKNQDIESFCGLMLQDNLFLPDFDNSPGVGKQINKLEEENIIPRKSLKILPIRDKSENLIIGNEFPDLSLSTSKLEDWNGNWEVNEDKYDLAISDPTRTVSGVPIIDSLLENLSMEDETDYILGLVTNLDSSQAKANSSETFELGNTEEIMANLSVKTENSIEQAITSLSGDEERNSEISLHKILDDSQNLMDFPTFIDLESFENDMEIPVVSAKNVANAIEDLDHNFRKDNDNEVSDQAQETGKLLENAILKEDTDNNDPPDLTMDMEKELKVQEKEVEEKLTDNDEKIEEEIFQIQQRKSSEDTDHGLFSYDMVIGQMPSDFSREICEEEHAKNIDEEVSNTVAQLFQFSIEDDNNYEKNCLNVETCSDCGDNEQVKSVHMDIFSVPVPKKVLYLASFINPWYSLVM